MTSNADWPERLYKHLQTARKKGSVSPIKPITGEKIARRYNDLYQAHFSDRDVRDWVNNGRKRGMLFGSCSQGYFVALNEKELEGTERHLHSRAMKELKAESGMKKGLREKNQNTLLSDPKFLKLQEEFELEEI